jgi:uncharacterized protein YdhG (YjbR/CyaY superfamily)
MPNSAAVIQWARVSRGGGGDDTGTANSRRSGSIQSSDVLINFLKGARTMSPTKTATRSTQASAKRSSGNGKPSKGFTDDEKAAMRERARELKAEAAKADGEAELLAAIAKMEEPARAMAKKLHSLIKAAAPALAPKTWYGMPAYAKDGNVICWFQNAGKFKARYQTLGFSDKAKLDDGAMWPNSYALLRLTAADEAKVTALVKKAVR